MKLTDDQIMEAVWKVSALRKLAKELEDDRLIHAQERRAAGMALSDALDEMAIPHDKPLKAGTIAQDGYIFQVRRVKPNHYELRIGKSLAALHRQDKSIPVVAWSLPVNDQSELALALIAVEKHLVYWQRQTPEAKRLHSRDVWFTRPGFKAMGADHAEANS